MRICRSVLVGCLGIVSGFSRGFHRVALGMPWDVLGALFGVVLRLSWDVLGVPGALSGCPPRVLSGCPGIVLGISQAFPRATLRVPSDFPSGLSGFAQGHGQASFGLSEVSSEDVS